MLDAKFAAFKGKSIAEYVLSGSIEAEIREALVGILETTLTSADEKYLLKYGIRIVELAAIRLQLELGDSKQPGDFVVIPIGRFPIHQQGQSFIEAEFLMG